MLVAGLAVFGLAAGGLSDVLAIRAGSFGHETRDRVPAAPSPSPLPAPSVSSPQSRAASPGYATGAAQSDPISAAIPAGPASHSAQPNQGRCVVIG